jgi:DNA-binding NarL/FixJ family response regulator
MNVSQRRFPRKGIPFSRHAVFDGGSFSLPLKKPIRIFIAESQTPTRRSFASMIDGEPGLELVGVAENGALAEQTADLPEPHIVLLDHEAPGFDGAALVRQILQDRPDAQVIVRAGPGGDNHIFDFICAGAQACLPHDADDSEIRDTIRAVARGQSRLSPALTRKLIDEFRRLCHKARRDDVPYCTPEEPLTNRERDILQLIIEGNGNRAIASKLKLAEGTVKNYVSRIMEKSNARSRTELAVKSLNRRCE